MAIFIPSVLVPHLRGRIGDLVYKNINGRTFVSRRPDVSSRKPTAEQVAQQNQFRAAVFYAKGMRLDPVRVAFYARCSLAEQKPAFGLAVRDFCRPPTVDEIDLTAYRGKVGDRIGIFASDDCGVARVEVVIRDVAGALVERGPATVRLIDWVYTATSDVPSGQSLTIEVTAYDRPMNVGTKSVPWVRSPTRHRPAAPRSTVHT